MKPKQQMEADMAFVLRYFPKAMLHGESYHYGWRKGFHYVVKGMGQKAVGDTPEKAWARAKQQVEWKLQREKARKED